MGKGAVRESEGLIVDDEGFRGWVSGWGALLGKGREF